MKMIDGATFLAWSNRSRTRLAPTPTIASMNSDAEIEKNGTPPPGDGPGEQGLARAGRAGEQHAPRDPRPEPACSAAGSRRKSTISPHLVLDLVDAGDVGERRPRPGVRLVEGRPGPAEPAEPAEAAAGGAPREEPQQQPDEQQGRAEADEICCHKAAGRPAGWR